jgi:hypothetical protein
VRWSWVTKALAVVPILNLFQAINWTMQTAVHPQITTQVTQSDTAQALAELCVYVRVHSERAAVQTDIESPVRARWRQSNFVAMETLAVSRRNNNNTVLSPLLGAPSPQRHINAVGHSIDEVVAAVGHACPFRFEAAGPGDNVLVERRLEHALARGRQESSKRLESAY